MQELGTKLQNSLIKYSEYSNKFVVKNKFKKSQAYN